MHPTAAHRTSLFAKMKAGALVITPNKRLSQQLLEDYFKMQNQPVLTKPLCLPYTVFLQHLYKELHNISDSTFPLLLSTFQQRQVWQMVIEESGYHSSFGLLNEVQEAWRRCCFWNIDGQSALFSYTSQTAQFQAWQGQFRQQLRRLNAITEEELVPFYISLPNPPSYPSCIWVSFDDFTPQQLALQSWLAKNSPQSQEDLPARQEINSWQYSAQDQAEEESQLISWINQRLTMGEERIAVVVPDLQNTYSYYQRLFARHFAPQEFNLSLGNSLADYPMIAHALTWLEMDTQWLSHHHASLLLHSPYIAYAETEFFVRSQLLQDCRALKEDHISHAQLVKELAASTHLAKILQTVSDFPPQATPNAWAHLFRSRLQHFGFPGEASLTSLSYQCFQRFSALLDEFSALEWVRPQMSRDQALAALKELASMTIFQAQKSNARIQILGLLEASGCIYDSLWVCSMNDQTLPQKTRLSAFTPLHIQREYQMPHALSERELALAEKLMQRLQYGAKYSVFSYAQLLADTPQLPSPLIRELPHLDPITTTIVATKNYLTPLSECYVIPFLATEEASGGTAILADQAKCPFRAFATHRLHAKKNASVSLGIDVQERGQILHTVMEHLWRELKDQQGLLQCDTDDLDCKLDRIIEDTLNPFTISRSYSFPPLVQKIECTRLKSLALALLAWEKQRPPFKVIALEQAYTLQWQGMSFRVRLDRIDQVGDSKWVIDYKTTLPANKPWNQERPEEPQLLFYALLDPAIHALLFLQLKAGRLTCRGIGEDNIDIQGVEAPAKDEIWSTLTQKWQAQLQIITKEFLAGECAPNPTKTSVCQRCDYQKLCRIELS